MIYIAVTADKYELPLFVGNGREVAAWAGITENNLHSQVSKHKSGKNRGYKFVKVEEE